MQKNLWKSYDREIWPDISNFRILHSIVLEILLFYKENLAMGIRHMKLWINEKVENSTLFLELTKSCRFFLLFDWFRVPYGESLVSNFPYQMWNFCENGVIIALVEFWRHELIFDHNKTISRHGLCNQRVSNDAAYMFTYLYDTPWETQTGSTSEIRRKKVTDNQFKEIISNISHMFTTVAIIYRL